MWRPSILTRNLLFHLWMGVANYTIKYANEKTVRFNLLIIDINM